MTTIRYIWITGLKTKVKEKTFRSASAVETFLIKNADRIEQVLAYCDDYGYDQ